MVQRMAMRAEMVTIDCADPRSLARFWTAAAGYVAVDDRGGEFHTDRRTPDRKAEVARLVGLGATVHAEHEAGSFAWTVLADPDGNEFCVAEG
jgi:hypothetical protein